MKECIIVAQCDVCGIKYSAVEDDRQVARTGVYQTQIKYNVHGEFSGITNKDFNFGDVCENCREKILRDFEALGGKYIKKN